MRAISGKINEWMGTLSEEIEANTSEKVVNIGEYQDSSDESSFEMPLDDDEMAQECIEIHPEFYEYMRGVEGVVGFSHCMDSCPELQSHTKALIRVENKYMPGAPFSNVFDSYYNYWSHFDMVIARSEETLGTVFFDLMIDREAPESLQERVHNLNMSRMGVFVHEGCSKEGLCFRELVTNQEIIAVPSSTYEGKKGEVWFARALPCLEEEVGKYIFMTTPYVIQDTQESDWIRFFEANKISGNDLKTLYKLMKRGKRKYYWIDYIAKAPSMEGPEVMFLYGMPK